MWTKKRKAGGHPACSLSNDEISDKTEKDEAPITLVLKWSKQPRKKQIYLEKSLQSWFNKREKGFNSSVVRILEDKNALIKIEPFPDVEIFLKLFGENLTLEDDTTVTVESVILGSQKLNVQTADDASMTSTSSISDDKERMNTSKDDKKKLKDGNVSDKNTQSSTSSTSAQTSQRDPDDQGAAASSDFQKDKKEEKKEEHEADDNSACSSSSTELLDNTEKGEKLITLKLKWSATANTPDKYLEESLKTWFKQENKDLTCSVVKIEEDKTAVIKIHRSTAAEILWKLSGANLTLKDGTKVTVESVILGSPNSPKLNTQTADEASMTSTPSTSDDQGQMNSQSDQVYSPDQNSKDDKKKLKDGNVSDKNTQSSTSYTSAQTSQRDPDDQGAAASSDFQKDKKEEKREEHNEDSNQACSSSSTELLDNSEKDGKQITLVLNCPKNVQEYQEKSFKTWLKQENKDMTCSVVKTEEDNKAVIKIELSTAAEILQKLSGANLTFKDGTKVTVEPVILGSPNSPKLNTDEASMTSTPSTSDDQGQMNSQSVQDSVPDQPSKDDKKKSNELGIVPDKNTTNQKNKVDDVAGTSSDFSKGNIEKIRRKTEKPDNQAASLSNTELSNKKEDEASITLILKWSKQHRKKQTYLEKCLQIWFEKNENGFDCSVVKIFENQNALIKITPTPGLKIVQKLSGETLTLKDGTTVTVESVILGSPKLNPQTEDDASIPSTSHDKGQVNRQRDQDSILEQTSFDDKKKPEDGNVPDKHTVSGQKRNQNDSDFGEEISPEKQIRQNQEDAVPVPVNLFWYVSQVYKEEIKRIEKETECEMETTLNVTFKAKHKDGSQEKAVSEFTNLVQKNSKKSRESVIPVQNVSPQQCSEAFKLIQKNEKKTLLTLTPKEITVCGPDSPHLKSVLKRNAFDEKPYLLHDDTPLKIKTTIRDPLTEAGIKMEERTWKTLNTGHDDKMTKIKEKFDVDFKEVRLDGGEVQVKASSNGPEGNPSMESNAVRALLRLYQKSVTSCLNFTQLQGASGFRNWPKMHKDESEKRPIPEGGATGGDSREENCPICLSPFTDKKSLNCKHEFCKLCLQQAEKSIGPICPICRKVFGIMQGNQPDGHMTWTKSPGPVPGFPNCGITTITYNIPSGIQTEKHPKPGHYYTGTTRTAYLPDNKEGNEVLKLLMKAFDQKLIFTIGASRTTGCENQVTWNDIHHKTSLYGGPDRNGYPDPNYLSRVREELKAKGIE